MALHVHRGSGDVVGRPLELAAIGQEIASARTGRLVGLTLEGEPGIGKTRLLLAAREQAEQAGFTTIAVTADEELRGPFLVARSILGSQEAVDAAAGGVRRRIPGPLPGGDVGTGRSRARQPPVGSAGPPHVRPGRGRVPRARGGSRPRDLDRRRPVGRRRQPSHASLRRPRRRREPDPPALRRPAGGVRFRDRGREPDRGHGPHGGGPPPEGQPVHARGDGGVPRPGARRRGRPEGCRR